MGEIKECCLSIILVFILLVGISSFFDFNGEDSLDDSKPSNITINVNQTKIHAYYDEDSPSNYSYHYHISYKLDNVSSFYEDAKITCSFYEGNKLVDTDEKTVPYLSESFYADHSTIFLDNRINITHVLLKITKDNKEFFNKKIPFDSSNFEIVISEEDHKELEEDEEENNTTVDDRNSGVYVASSESNIFHDPSCVHAEKIKDSNKITFSTKEEAFNAGYTPCGDCHPG